MNLEFKLPDELKASDIHVIREEERQGVKKMLDRIYRASLNRRYHPLKIPICCEYCLYVGEAMWHCHNPQSIKNGINVMPWDVCSKWVPNSGLLMFLHRKYLDMQRERDSKPNNPNKLSS
jgi:hypothetical protein